MRTIEGLKWVCEYGTVPTIGTRVWDKIIVDEETMKEVSRFGENTMSCASLKFSPHVNEINTQLSVDFFNQMDECGQYAYEDFMKK
jgi:hypothetical protein